jgi:hypothetical protein
MKFTTAKEVDGFDFSPYTLEEIRGAISVASVWVPNGQIVNNDKSRALANELRVKGLSCAAIMYLQKTHKSTVRIITPFNLQVQLAEKYTDYVCNSQMLKCAKVCLPMVANFPNYTDHIARLGDMLPGSKIIPFDAAFCLNVSNAAAITSYKYENGLGKVVPITPPQAMYDGVPYSGAAFAATFDASVAGSVSLTGLAWAHFMYSKFYDTREPFMQTFSALTEVAKAVKTRTPLVWTKLFSPSAWKSESPKTDVQKVECLVKMQAYRSKDNAGISALTYSAYGEEFGEVYRLAEKMNNFRIFLSSLGEEYTKFKVRYITRDEHDLVYAMRVCNELGYELVHYMGHEVDGVEHTQFGLCDYTDQVVFAPKCMTSPFSGKNSEENVDEYVENNIRIVQQRFVKYAGCKVLGYRAHVLGMEKYVIGIAAPHNAIGVMCSLNTRTLAVPLWNLIMTANHVRNTFLYHRKTLEQFLVMIDLVNSTRREKGLPEIVYMPWKRMVRPPWFAFTKEQRKRNIILLREWEEYGDVRDDISDQDLSDMVAKANDNPEFLSSMARIQKEEEKRKDPYGSVATKHTVSQADDFFGSMSTADDMDVIAPPPKKRTELVMPPAPIVVTSKQNMPLPEVVSTGVMTAAGIVPDPVVMVNVSPGDGLDLGKT